MIVFQDSGPNVVSSWKKFRIILGKNAILKWRHKFKTGFELLIPVLTMLLVCYTRAKMPSSMEPSEITTYEPAGVYDIFEYQR